MEMENESNAKETTVKELQATLFPVQQVKMSNYFSNFFFKSIQVFDENEDSGDTKLKNDLIRDPLARETNFKRELPRWPTECQVAETKIKHINYVPSNPEPYYVPSGNEATPKPIGEECGIIVYQYSPISIVNYFTRSSFGGSKYLLSPIIYEDDNTLQFESRFECGNLEKAYKITPNFYELQLRPDLYTNRHMQWFYFRITNMKKNFLYRFSIINFSKDSSLFNEGMRPLMYSVKDAQLHQIGWRRFGDNIIYYSNDNVTPEDPEAQMTYTLTFTTEFPHEHDEVYFANCYPYSYSDLEDYLAELTSHPIKSEYTTVRLLCKSLAGNNVHQITITSPDMPDSDTLKKKRAVVITARVHPGETPASWMMKGFLDYLTSDCSVARELRERFVFKLVPMLNPDGVIVGNNRCALSTKDLNRQYRTVMKEAYPSIWYTKLMVRRLLEDCGVVMYCDLHAHSRKHNIFIYGCENRKGAENKLQEQVFPLLLHKNTADKFCFESCKFRIQKSKEGTGRIVMWMMGISNSYTMEASFAGSMLGSRANTHFSTQDFEQMGKSFCQTLFDFYDESPRKEKLRNKIISRLVKEGSNADEPTNIELSDYSSDEGDTSSSSSNEVGRDDEEVLCMPVPPPPSPAITAKKPKAKIKAKKSTKKSETKNVDDLTKTNVVRKPLPMCRATLGLNLAENKCKYFTTDDSSSESDEYSTKKSVRVKEKQRKKVINHVKNETVETKKVTYSSCEIIYTECVQSPRSYSANDIIVNKEKLKHNFVKKSTKISQSKITKNNSTTQQLSQVQAKLLSMRKRLWLGAGDEDIYVPLSWGTSDFNLTEAFSNPKFDEKNDNRKKKTSNKNNQNNNKAEQGLKVTKAKENVEVKKKPRNGLRRQKAVDLEKNITKQDKLRKVNSCPNKSLCYVAAVEKNEILERCNSESSLRPTPQMDSVGKNDTRVKYTKTKKKKKRPKSMQKAKTLNN